jgi:MFS family permease
MASGVRHHGPVNLRLDFQPLRSPAYRRYITGWSLMLTCGWIFYTAQTWTFLQNSGTAAAVAFLPIALVLPVPVALVIGGLLTDRRGPRSVLVIAQTATGLTVATIGVLAVSGNLTFWPTLITGALLGTFGGLGSVPGQAIMLRLVDPRQVASAYGLSLMTFGIGRLAGGPIGGIVVQSLGPGAAFGLAAAGYLVAAALFATLPRLEGLQAATAGLSRRDLVDVLRWARLAPAVLALLGMEAIAAGLIAPYTAVMPVIARDLLRGGSGELGLLIAAGGAGVVLGGLVMAPLGRRFGHGRFLVAAVALSIMGVAGLSLSSSLILSCVLAAVAGGADNASALTRGLLLQTFSPARLRGRVLALDGVVSAVANPACLLAVGLLVASHGAGPVLFGMSGLAAAGLAALVVAHRPVAGLVVADGGAPDGAVAADGATAADARAAGG